MSSYKLIQERMLRPSQKLFCFKWGRSDRFCDLIFDQKWVQLISLLENPTYQKYLKKACGPFHFHYFNYLTMIHFACMMTAPPYVIMSLVNAFPSSVILPDKIKRLPLHICCKYGAGEEVISFLLKKSPGSVNKQDLYGKTPLHLACECKAKTSSEMEASFNILMKASPSSLILTDSRGLSVLDYAVQKKLDFNLIQLIKWEIRKQENHSLSVIEEESNNSAYSP